MYNSDIRKHLDHNPNVICDICGRKRKTSDTTLAFGSGDIPVVVSCLDGCADERHPLNSPPPIIFDGQPVPNARPDQRNEGSVLYGSVVWGSFYGSPKWSSFPVSMQIWGQMSPV